MTIINLAHYQSYFEIEVKGRKPRLGHHVNINYQGRSYKGIVIELGRTVLCKAVI
jgi:hypothetical protein